VRFILFIHLSVLLLVSSSFTYGGTRGCQGLFWLLNREKPRALIQSQTKPEWPKSITQDSSQLAQIVENELIPLFRSAEHGYFKTRDGVNLAYSHFQPEPKSLINGKPKATLLVGHGLGESRLHWLDQIKTFTKEGYEVFIYEHRGQAHSDRPLANYHKVHIEKFSDYVDDMHEFIEQKLQKKGSTPTYGIGFSLGGLISTLNYIQHPEDFSALIAISPAYQIRTHHIPRWLAKLLVDTEIWLGNDKEYSYFQGDFNPKKLRGLRRHIHDPDRWELFLYILRNYPLATPGGLTHRWVSQILQADQLLQRQFTQIRKPTLVMEAQKDALVPKTALEKLTSHHPWISTYTDANSFHSMIHESDSIRNPALTEILRYLVHPERLDSPDTLATERLILTAENFLKRNEIAFSKYAIEEAALRWKQDHPQDPAPEKIDQLARKIDEQLALSSEGQKALYQFIYQQREIEKKKLYLDN
jgi:lysophospholipase